MSPTWTRDEAVAFAREWAEAWNRLDIESVLAHFHDDVEFRSPTAMVVVGEAVVRGKPALRAYWEKALARIGSLRFTIDRVLWDADRSELAIVYESTIDGTRRRVSENLVFDPEGRVVRAEVFHGVA